MTVTKKATIGELQSFSYVLDYASLLSGAAGTQDAITLHDILPEGWEVYDVDVETETAFNGSGTRALNIGVVGALTGIVSALDVKSAGIKAPTVTKKRMTASAAITAQLVTATDNPTAGQIRITLLAYPARREE